LQPYQKNKIKVGALKLKLKMKKTTLNIRKIEYTTTKIFELSIFLDHLIKSVVNVIFQYMF